LFACRWKGRPMAKERTARILIVDDEKWIRDSLGEFFTDYQLPTQTVSSAEAGLKLLGARPFDLAIVDIRLPGMNGDQFVLAANQMRPGIKVIIHTGSVHFRLTDELAQVGLRETDIFTKPVLDLQDLRKHVLTLLQAEIVHE